MIAGWLWGCAGTPPEVTIELWGAAPGRSVDQVDAELAGALERALAEVPGATRLRTEIAPGRVRIGARVPEAELRSLPQRLDALEWPDELAPPWVTVAPAEVTTWVVTAADPPTLDALLPALLRELETTPGVEGAWTTTPTPRAWVGVLAPGAPIAAADLPRGNPLSGPVSFDDLLAARVGDTTLGERLVAPPEPEVRARSSWGGRPAALVHVAGADDVAARVAARGHGASVVRWPSRGVRLEAWGPLAVERATAWAAEVGADAGLLIGRAVLPGEAGARVELVLDVDPASLPEALATEPTLVSWDGDAAARAVALGAPTNPPRSTEWDVVLDPDRLADLGLPIEEAAFAVRLATAGVPLPADDRTLLLRSGPEPASLAELAAVPVGRVTLGDLAELRAVEAERYRAR